MKRHILSLLGIILSILIFVSLIVWFGGRWFILSHDSKENKERAEYFYKELSQKYKTTGGYPFEMNYTYDRKKNLGFFSGGGFIGTNCWERYIKEAWTNKHIISISLCVNEKITKEKLERLNEFWEKYEEIFIKR